MDIHGQELREFFHEHFENVADRELAPSLLRAMALLGPAAKEDVPYLQSLVAHQLIIGIISTLKSFVPWHTLTAWNYPKKIPKDVRNYCFTNLIRDQIPYPSVQEFSNNVLRKMLAQMFCAIGYMGI